jgi:multicomponent K+:H+ antiporter subunit A
MSAWLAARPFLSALAWHGILPIIGEMHLSTVLLFDLGVFFLVIGAAVLILVALAHQSRRAHRKQEVAEVETPVEVPVEVPGSLAGQGAGGHAPASLSAPVVPAVPSDYPPVEAERQKLPHVLPPKERED